MTFLRRPICALRGGAGFTLLELLVVIIVLGIAAAVVVPQLSGGGGAASVTMAARSAAGAIRYARMMALLHQAETEVSFDPSTGAIAIRAVVGETKSRLIGEALEGIDFDAEDDDSRPDETDALRHERLAGHDAGLSTAHDFAAEVEQTKVWPEGSYSFGGYADSVDNDGGRAASAEQQSAFSVRFRSNGTCRPFKFSVFAKDAEPDGEKIEVTVNAMGRASIRGFGDGE